jgi:hypothetical protein
MFRKTSTQNSETVTNREVVPYPDATPEQLTRLVRNVETLWNAARAGETRKGFDVSFDGMFATFTQQQDRRASAWSSIVLYPDYDGTWSINAVTVRPGLETEMHGALVRETDTYPVSVVDPVITGKTEVCTRSSDGTMTVIEVKNEGIHHEILNQKQSGDLATTLDMLR